jgi:hypothetical protein
MSAYFCEGFSPIDSDDPRLNDSGMIGAAMIFASRAAKREFGSDATDDDSRGASRRGQSSTFQRLGPVN